MGPRSGFVWKTPTGKTDPRWFVGRGHGSAIVRQFVEQLFEEGAPRVIIDPDPANVRALLPQELGLAEDDPGAVAFIWADWQSCSDTGAELLDPSRSQYLEAFVVVRCTYQGTTYSRCVLIWVTTDFAIGRGWFQGYPKKFGSIFVTRPYARGKAAPRIADASVTAANNFRSMQIHYYSDPVLLCCGLRMQYPNPPIRPL